MREATALKKSEARREPRTGGSGTTRLRPPHPRSPEEDLNGLRMAARAAGPSMDH